MKTFQYTIKDPLGLHARPAGLLVKAVGRTDSHITIQKGDKQVLANRLLSLMGLGISCGDVVTVEVDGGNEDASIAVMKDFFEKHL